MGIRGYDGPNERTEEGDYLTPTCRALRIISIGTDEKRADRNLNKLKDMDLDTLPGRIDHKACPINSEHPLQPFYRLLTREFKLKKYDITI